MAFVEFKLLEICIWARELCEQVDMLFRDG